MNHRGSRLPMSPWPVAFWPSVAAPRGVPCQPNVNVAAIYRATSERPLGRLS